jgi:lysozyme family protein
MRPTPIYTFASLMIIANVAAAGPSGGEVITINNGEIVEYACGDNCWLTIKDDIGADRVALCVAPICESWNEFTRIPERFIGKKVKATLGVNAGEVLSYDEAGEPALLPADAWTQIAVLSSDSGLRPLPPECQTTVPEHRTWGDDGAVYGIAAYNKCDSINRGMDAPEIRAIQRLLGVKADGVIGPGTLTAICQWNRKHGIKHDYVTDYMLETAGSSDAPAAPSYLPDLSREELASVQKFLGVKPDGVWGPTTAKAVATWNRRNGLEGEKVTGRLFAEAEEQHPNAYRNRYNSFGVQRVYGVGDSYTIAVVTAPRPGRVKCVALDADGGPVAVQEWSVSPPADEVSIYTKGASVHSVSCTYDPR